MPLTCLETADIACLEPLFGRVVGVVASLAGIVLLIMLIVGGYKYLISGGDPKKLEAAKGTLTSAFLGLVLIVASYIILNIIANFTGLTELTQFKIVTF